MGFHSAASHLVTETMECWTSGTRETQLLSWGQCLGGVLKVLQMMLHGENLWENRKAPTEESSRNQGGFPEDVSREQFPGNCPSVHWQTWPVSSMGRVVWPGPISSALILDAASHKGTVFEPGAGALWLTFVSIYHFVCLEQ